MTISTTSNTSVSQGNGFTNTFNFSFIIPLVAELFVTYVDTNDVEWPLSSSQYSVSGLDNPSGGVVTYPLTGSPIPIGSSLIIQRIVAYQQLTSLVNQSGYYPNVVEQALDNLTMQTQQLAAASQLALTVGQSSTAANLILPSSSTIRANNLVGFDVNGNVVLYPVTSSVGAGDLISEGPFVAGVGFTPGVTTSLVLSRSYGTAANVTVHYDGTYQGVDQYSINGDTITFIAPIPVGVNKVYIVGGTTLSMNVPSEDSIGINQLQTSVLNFFTGFLQSMTGAIQETVGEKLTEIKSFKDCGAVGDGIANDTIAIQNGELNVPVFSPAGTYSTTIANGATLTGRYFGQGQVKTADGNKRAPYFSSISAPPSSTVGTPIGVDTAFNGDLSKSQYVTEMRITGATTLGQPSSAYQYTPEAYPHYDVVYNTSGYQNPAGSGRTGVAAYFTNMFHYGSGDSSCYIGNTFVDGVVTSTTHCGLNPSGGVLDGQVTAGANYMFLDAIEVVAQDGGFDCAGFGAVIDLYRTNNTGGAYCWWQGIRVQSEGTVGIDVGFGLTGPANIGIDLSWATLPATGNYIQAAMTLAATQRIYLNATVTDPSGYERFPSNAGNTYITYSGSAVEIVVGANPSLQISATQTTIDTATLLHAGTVFGVNGSAGASQVTGWGTPTSPSVVANFSGGAATLVQCSTAIAEIIANLKSVGIYGA